MKHVPASACPRKPRCSCSSGASSPSRRRRFSSRPPPTSSSATPTGAVSSWWPSWGGPSGSGLAHPHSLEDLARDLGIASDVRFVQPVTRPELARWYRAADLVAVPSHSESFGLVAVEAQACGTPVVAADVGGLPTAVGDAGVLVDGHDPRRWADHLERLLIDKGLRAQLAERAVRHAGQFGWERTTDRLLEVYRAACRQRTPSPIGEATVLTGVPAAVVP